MSCKDLHNYFEIHCPRFENYKYALNKLMEHHISVLCENTDNMYYTINYWIHMYLEKYYMSEKKVANTFEIKNYSTFDLKVKIKMTESYIIYEPYNSAVDRYVIFEILYPFIRKRNLLQETKHKLIIIKNIDRINIKHHKYISYLLKTYHSICTFLFTTNNKYSVSEDILQNIHIFTFPLSLHENENLFWEKNETTHIKWEDLLNEILQTFFVKQSSKVKDLKWLRISLSNLYTSNIPSQYIIMYLLEHMEYYNFSEEAYSHLLDKLCEIEYYLKIGNRYILHLEYLILYFSKYIKN